MKIVRGELGRRVNQQVENEARAGRMMTGRQCLFMIYDHLKIDEEAGSLFDLSDLMCVQLEGDDLETFWKDWELALSSMRSEVPDNVKKTLFRLQLDKCKALHDEMAYYYRQRPGHADRSYRYLAERVRRWIERRRLSSNRRLVARALGGNRSLYPVVPATRDWAQ